MVFLDTHVAIWLYQKSLDLLSKKAMELIDLSKLYISPIVYLEIEYLYEIKRIKKGAKPIFEYLKKQIDLEIAYKDNMEGIYNQSLSEKWTRDPFDRIIVAHARFMESTLISKDQKILKHYKKGIE